MKAVIMAGGEGSRLRPLTCDRPKPLVPVCNRPVMAFTLDLLAEHGFQEVFVTLGYMPASISAHFGTSHRGMLIRYAVERSPLGTAGSVAALRSQLDDTFVVISGDALTDIDLSRLMRLHRERRALVTLATMTVEDPCAYGIVTGDRQGRVRRFREKPGWGEVFSNTVNTGIYVIEPAVLGGIPLCRPYDFSRDLFPALLQMDAPLFAHPSPGYWCDVGDPRTYLRANLDLLGGKLAHRPPGTEVAPGVWTMEPISQGILVDGSALIGEGCQLAPGTLLEGGAVLGPGTVSGEDAIISRSVTWSGVQIGAGARLTGVIMCDGSTLGEGSIVLEGAIVGRACAVRERAMVSSGIKLWPRQGARG